MKRIVLALLLALGSIPSAFAQGVPNSAQVVSNCGSPPSSYNPGQNQPVLQDSTGRQCVQVTGGTGTSSTFGATFPATGTAIGAANGGNMVDLAADASNGLLVAGEGTAAAPAGGVISTVPMPSAASSIGITPTVTSALAANLVVKGSAGNLYSFDVSVDSTLSGAAWWFMIYNATSAPADGAVLPIKCYAFSIGTTGFTAGFFQPIYFSTGITMGVSTTGCYTKTSSTHAFIAADAK